MLLLSAGRQALSFTFGSRGRGAQVKRALNGRLHRLDQLRSNRLRLFSPSSSSIITRGRLVTVVPNKKSQQGEKVERQAVVEENRGSGWFRVRFVDDGSIQAFRRTQLRPVMSPPFEATTTIGSGETSETMVVNTSSETSEVSGSTSSPAKSTGRGSEDGNDDESSAPSLPSTTTKPRNTQTQVIAEHISITSSSTEAIDFPPIPTPTIHDLDTWMNVDEHENDAAMKRRDKEFLQQCRYFATFQQWVAFTDLHCSSITLDTCLEVLRKVHDEAESRQAGVIFCGDWWHLRGSLRIDLLNAVLRALSTWNVPMIMMPGNHDMVTLRGDIHGLTPLENAYRLEVQDDDSNSYSVPGLMVFTNATKFCDALFVPYIRDNAVMETILFSEKAASAHALFVHADVKGARMNDLIVSTHGVQPSSFPAHKPIYSGHFHLPHNVTTTMDQTIQYLGSPYEVSLSEAGQEKCLWILEQPSDNATVGWRCRERVPLSIGPKHYRVHSHDDFLRVTNAKKGDRVVVSIEKGLLDELRRDAFVGENQEEPSQMIYFDAHVNNLRQAGVTVEIQETKPTMKETADSVDTKILEECTPQGLLEKYFDQELETGSIGTSTVEILRREGLALVEKLVESEGEQDTVRNQRQNIDLTFVEVTIQGFGPYADEVTYPLYNRGLVRLQGVNKDGGSDSNGSGKSWLAMSSLWALTNSMDARPMRDGTVTDVVNDRCQFAKVTLRGMVNGVEFLVSRKQKKAKGAALTFLLQGNDLTAQSTRDTQLLINEKLGLNALILGRTIFHGQHDLNGLLETTDSALKEELSIVVPLDLWKACAKRARADSKKQSTKSIELETLIGVRESDMEIVRRKIETLDAKIKTKLQELTELSSAKENIPSEDLTSRDGLRTALLKADHEIRIADEAIHEAKKTWDSEREVPTSLLQSSNDELSIARQQVQTLERQLDRDFVRLETAETRLSTLKQKWEFTNNGVDQVCPTCHRPFDSEHDRRHVLDTMKVELDESQVEFEYAMSEKDRSSESLGKLRATEIGVEEKRMAAETQLMQVDQRWDSKVDELRKEILAAQQRHKEIALLLLEGDDQSELRMQRSEIIAETDVLQKQQSDLKNDLAEIEGLLAQLKNESAKAKDRSSVLSSLVEVFGTKGIQVFVLQNAIDSLQTITQGYLDELSDRNLRLDFILEDGDKIQRRASIRAHDGEFVDRPMSSLSGGQWRRCAIALSLGFSDLLASRGKLRPSLLVLDEPLTFLDQVGRVRFAGLLQKMVRKDDSVGATKGLSASTVLFILQDLAAEDLEESFDCIDVVTKENGMSTVHIDDS